jgi:hypothetical protein
LILSYSDTVNQWIIYDTYQKSEREKELQEDPDCWKRRSNQREPYTKESIRLKKKTVKKPPGEIDTELSIKFMKAARTLERMVNQTTNDQVIKGHHS